MMRKLIATAVVTGSLAFGAVGLVGWSGVAGAASPSTSTSPATHATKCAKAEKLATWIQGREAKAAVWLPKAQDREAKATAAGNTTLATRISDRITRVQKLEAKGNTVLAKIEAKCGAATGTPAT
jgi:hypothetical protein